MPELSYVQWVEVTIIAAIVIFAAYIFYSLDLFRKG